MSWRAGLTMFLEMIPIVNKYETDDEFRQDFLAKLLKLFLDEDMAPDDMEDDPILGPIYAHLLKMEEEIK